eukprot:TRINITY_DN1555_c0_g1_i2.p1 TRINITY_DN1555_c0_g1~~TRINITY_DN1555_c0_g1_i2.p1  ORF type:complete len:307 (+),score=28.83 TRINITY_DN1555_c0_g1_i2:90-1010(+)
MSHKKIIAGLDSVPTLPELASPANPLDVHLPKVLAEEGPLSSPFGPTTPRTRTAWGTQSVSKVMNTLSAWRAGKARQYQDDSERNRYQLQNELSRTYLHLIKGADSTPQPPASPTTRQPFVRRHRPSPIGSSPPKRSPRPRPKPPATQSRVRSSPSSMPPLHDSPLPQIPRSNSRPKSAPKPPPTTPIPTTIFSASTKSPPSAYVMSNDAAASADDAGSSTAYRRRAFKPLSTTAYRVFSPSFRAVMSPDLVMRTLARHRGVQVVPRNTPPPQDALSHMHPRGLQFFQQFQSALARAQGESPVQER